jgi:RNA polymerase sigma factor (sigma-70 family)
MLEFQLGSRNAFEELYSRYRGPLYGFFRRRLSHPQRAEDLAQETFLAVIRGVSRYEPRALKRTYLYGIAPKLLASEWRKERREPVIMIGALNSLFPAHKNQDWGAPSPCQAGTGGARNRDVARV